MTQQQLEAIRRIAGAIVETAREAGPLGAPSGVVYAALMTHGCTLDQYNQFIAGLEKAGLIEVRHNCIHAT